MRILCPKCDYSLSRVTETCPSCGYIWKIACRECGKQNAPTAKFCGECGCGLSWQARFEKQLNSHFDPETLVQLRNVAAGFIFGFALFVFAFGSMGMSNPDFLKIAPVWETHQPKSEFGSHAGITAYRSIQKSFSRCDVGRRATQADLVRVGNLLLEAFAPAMNPDLANFNRQGMAQSFKYLQTIEQSTEDLEEIPLKRSDVAIFLFRLMSDLFEIPAAEKATYRYSDIPQFHYMNLPVDTLDNVGLTLSREKNVFGADDHVTLEWLSSLSMKIVRSCEQRMKTKNFQALQPSAM